MRLTRRQFLTVIGGSTASAVIFTACGIPEKELLVQAPFEIPEDLVTGIDNWFATLCRQCPTPEGVVVRVMEGRAKKVEGNVDYPINRGRHSMRCEAGLQALYHPDRVDGPRVRLGERGEGRWEEISWTDALGRLTLQLKNLQDSRKQSSMVMVTDPVAGHQGMVVDKFVSAFRGRHVPYEPLERTVVNTAMKQVFNQDVMPDFDIENSQTLLSFGADFLNTWVSPVRYSRGYGEFRQGEGTRGTMYHFESRMSMTAAAADKWVYVKPGMEGALALSIAQVIVSENLGVEEAANALTGGGAFNLSAFAPEAISEKVGVSAEKITEIAREFANNRPALAIGGGAAAAHTNGLFNMAAIYSLNYLVGSVNQPGGVIFNPEPPLDDISSTPETASYGDWQDLITDMNNGDVQVMMLRGANPWYGLPEQSGFKKALFNVPFVFSFAEFIDDTTSMADLILPVHSYLEDWGSDVPNPGPGYQTIGFQQPVVRPFFEPRGAELGSRGFGDLIMAIAADLELDLGLPGETLKDVLQDGARKLFNLNRGSVRASSFQGFWNGVLQRGGWWDVSAKATGAAPTPPQLPEAEEPQFDSPDENAYPFHLMPFASASLTDGRGAHLAWLQAAPDPITSATWQTWVEINYRTAQSLGIKEGDIITVASPHGTIRVIAYPHPGVPFDVVSIPIGQGHIASTRYAEGRGANVYSLISPDLKDSKTGALAWASARVRIGKADDWKRLPKFENAVTEPPRDEEHKIIKLTSRST